MKLTPEQIRAEQTHAKQSCLERLHDVRAVLGAAGFHYMARETASLINQLTNAKPDGDPVIYFGPLGKSEKEIQAAARNSYSDEDKQAYT